jgi:hypothetical protein
MLSQPAGPVHPEGEGIHRKERKERRDGSRQGDHKKHTRHISSGINLELRKSGTEFWFLNSVVPHVLRQGEERLDRVHGIREDFR